MAALEQNEMWPSRIQLKIKARVLSGALRTVISGGTRHEMSSLPPEHRNERPLYCTCRDGSRLSRDQKMDGPNVSLAVQFQDGGSKFVFMPEIL